MSIAVDILIICCHWTLSVHHAEVVLTIAGGSVVQPTVTRQVVVGIDAVTFVLRGDAVADGVTGIATVILFHVLAVQTVAAYLHAIAITSTNGLSTSLQRS